MTHMMVPFGAALRRAVQSLANHTAKGIAPADDGLWLDTNVKWGPVSDSVGGSIQDFGLPV